MKEFYPFKYLVIIIIASCILRWNFAQSIHENEKGEIINKICGVIDSNYVFPQIAKICAESLRYNYNNGKFAQFNSWEKFVETINIELYNITNDKHNSLRIFEPLNQEEEKTGSLFHPLRYLNLGNEENLGFHQLEHLEGNIGYLDLRRFYFPPDATNILTGAINFLSNSDAIIIDLRFNQGGSIEMLPLISSYFLNHPTQLNSVYYRADDFTREFWTTNNISTKRLIEVPLFILTSDQTFSAAEYFAYDLQSRERAVLIGDSTKGGAHSVDLFQINDQLELYLSTARAINPVTGTNWEGIGVIPDIVVPAEMILDSAKTIAKHAAKEYRKLKKKKTIAISSGMQNFLNCADSLYCENDDELAQIYIDSAFCCQAKSNLINEFFLQVLIYHYSSIENNKMSFAIIGKYISIYPYSFYPYENMAFHYLEEEEKELAIVNFLKVLELEPNNHTAKIMLIELSE